MAGNIYSTKFKTSTGEIIEAVEYIQSSGKQYIDTGVGYSNAIRFQLAFKQTRFNTTYHGICGWSSSTGYRYNSANDTTLRCGLRTQDWVNFTVSSLDVNILDSYYNGTTTYNGTTLSIPKGSYVPTGGLALFAYDASPTANQIADVMKVYYCKVWNGTTLIRDLVPVRIVTTNEYCLYDMENDVLYHNKGTGAFTGGPFKPDVLKTKVSHIYFPKRTVDYEGTEYELTQVDYLDGKNTTNWINANMNTSANMTVRCIFRLDRTFANNSIIFASDRWNGNASLFCIQSSKFKFFGDSPQELATVLPTVGHTYDFSLTKVNNACTIVMKDLTAGTSTTKTSTDSYNGKPIYIGRCSAVGSYPNGMTLLRFEVDNGTVHKNFVPVAISGLSEYGLLDLVENKLYRNGGAGSFEGGDRTEVIKITELAGVDANGIRYGELDYLECDGAEYIDTGFKPNQNTSVEVSYEAYTGSNGSTLFFGSSSSWTGASFGIYRNGNATKIFSNYNNDTNITSYMSVAAFNGKHIVKQDKNVLYYDGVAKYTHTATTFQSTRNLLIGNPNDQVGTTNYAFKGKYYYVKVWDNNVLIRDFVPAQRLTDNVKGLFDRINKVFYTNSGTGVFDGTLNYIELGEAS